MGLFQPSRKCISTWSLEVKEHGKECWDLLPGGARGVGVYVSPVIHGEKGLTMAHCTQIWH